jgi:tRNA (cytidine/uridine-2'-O-)-methyltransferase
MHATGTEPQPAPAEPWLHVVLYQPEIPQNTGNIGRTCVALGAKLWMVRPIGFRLDASRLKRAGLDYWQYLDWEAVGGWDELSARLDASRMWLITKFGQVTYTDAQFAEGDIIVLGRESCGLPESLRAAHPAERQLALPMPGPVRSLNLSTTAGVVMYEAYRQLQPSPQSPPLGGILPAREEPA